MKEIDENIISYGEKWIEEGRIPLEAQVANICKTSIFIDAITNWIIKTEKKIITYNYSHPRLRRFLGWFFVGVSGISLVVMVISLMVSFL